MTTRDLLDMARDLNHHNAPYALVTVVRAIAPTSAYVGAQAIVLPDGTLHGWIGGGCAKEVVINAAQAAIEAGQPKLVRITNDRLQRAEGGIEQHAMSCVSNGTIELFIHPYGVGSALCVLGNTPSADEARFFADRLGIRLVESEAQAQIVLIATQGQGDEAALESALRSPAAHVLMIASRRKADRLRELMLKRGVEASQLARLHAPAGQDAGAQTPSEIALVSVAAVLAFLRGRTHAQENGSAEPAQPEGPRAQEHAAAVHESRNYAKPTTAHEHAGAEHAPSAAPRFVNPVCGMSIDTASAMHVENYQGTSYYFCCDGCWNTFRADPAKYASIHLQNRGPA